MRILERLKFALSWTRFRADRLMKRAFPLHRDGRLSEAQALYERILEIRPDHADALYLLGEICRQSGQIDRAIRLMQEAVRSNAREPAYHRSLGDIFSKSESWSLAASHYEAALQLDPASADLWNLLGLAHQEAGRLNEAESCFRKALQREPGNLPALNNLARASRNLGRPDQAIDALRKLHQLLPGDAETFSNLLFTLNLVTEPYSAADIFQEHRRFDALYGAGRFGRTRRELRAPDPERKLRIGYLSPDFLFHAVSYFIEPVLRHHDRTQYEIHCYHCHPRADHVTARLKALVGHWVDCGDWSDDAIAERIAADRVDILVDLAGHTSWNRLLVFARKPAPIQATWLGYLNTTGLTAMDYRITDRHADPVGVSDAYHTERLIRLPDSQWCYGRPDQDIEVAPLPALKNGRVRFGSFNKFSKLSDKVLALWAGVMRRLPDAALLLVGVPEAEQARLRGLFGHHGIAAQRLSMCDRVPVEQFRELHQRVDIAFDAHPYSGATTTCDSLWMGVPSLTLVGRTSISRSTASLLRSLGLDDWIARSDAEFIELAVRHATDLQSLAALRAGLRRRLEQSPIMDAAGFTAGLEHAFRSIWRDHCQQGSGARRL
jgi:predicted O-linked N-acetylglucosamine transferase (SPINDLY family)